MSRDEAQAFFTAYRDAFNQLDGDAVADLWNVPGGIAQGDGVTWWAQDAPMRANHRALCEAYARADYGRADFEVMHHESMGDDHAFACLRWLLTRHDGSLLQAFGTGYQLIRTADGPKVLLATAYEEDLKEMRPHVAE